MRVVNWDCHCYYFRIIRYSVAVTRCQVVRRYHILIFIATVFFYFDSFFLFYFLFWFYDNNTFSIQTFFSLEKRTCAFNFCLYSHFHIFAPSVYCYSLKKSLSPQKIRKSFHALDEKKIFVLAHSNKTINCCCVVITYIVAFHQPLVFSPAATLNRKHSLPLWMHNPRINNVFYRTKILLLLLWLHT